MKIDIGGKSVDILYGRKVEEALLKMLGDCRGYEDVLKREMTLRASIDGMEMLRNSFDEEQSKQWDTMIGSVKGILTILVRIENAVLAGAEIEDAIKGYRILNFGEHPDVKYISKVSGMERFKSSEDAGEYAKKYHGVKIINSTNFGISDGTSPNIYIDSDGAREYLQNMVNNDIEASYTGSMSTSSRAMELRTMYNRDLSDETYREIGDYILKNGLSRLKVIVNDVNKLNRAIKSIGKYMNDCGNTEVIMNKLRLFLNDVENGFKSSWDYSDCVRGFTQISAGKLGEAASIERIDDIGIFASDSSAAEYAKEVYGVKIIDLKKEYGIESSDNRFGYYIDSRINRADIEDALN